MVCGYATPEEPRRRGVATRTNGRRGLQSTARGNNAMPREIPTEAQVLGWYTSLSNWGRWGPDDELGTLNLITPEKRRQAAGLVSEGIVVSCARTIGYEPSPDGPVAPQHFMLRSGEGAVSE